MQINSALFLVSILLTSALGVILGLVSFSFVKMLGRFYTLRKKESDISVEALVDTAEKAQSEMEEVLDEVVKVARSEILKVITSISEQNRAELTKVAASEKALAISELRRTSEVVKGELQSIGDEAKKIIEEQRARSLKRIEEETLGLVQRVAKEVLGLTINPEEHRELVMNELKKLKLDHAS